VILGATEEMQVTSEWFGREKWRQGLKRAIFRRRPTPGGRAMLRQLAGAEEGGAGNSHAAAAVVEAAASSSDDAVTQQMRFFSEEEYETLLRGDYPTWWLTMMAPTLDIARARFSAPSFAAFTSTLFRITAMGYAFKRGTRPGICAKDLEGATELPKQRLQLGAETDFAAVWKPWIDIITSKHDFCRLKRNAFRKSLMRGQLESLPGVAGLHEEGSFAALRAAQQASDGGKNAHFNRVAAAYVPLNPDAPEPDTIGIANSRGSRTRTGTRTTRHHRLLNL
jgi:hypothetical protein